MQVNRIEALGKEVSGFSARVVPKCARVRTKG